MKILKSFFQEGRRIYLRGGFCEQFSERQDACEFHPKLFQNTQFFQQELRQTSKDPRVQGPDDETKICFQLWMSLRGEFLLAGCSLLGALHWTDAWWRWLRFLQLLRRGINYPWNGPPTQWCFFLRAPGPLPAHSATQAPGLLCSLNPSCRIRPIKTEIPKNELEKNIFNNQLFFISWKILLLSSTLNIRITNFLSSI